MKMHERATARVFDGRSIGMVVGATLLLAASLPLAAQDRSRARPNDSGGSGGREVVPRSAPSTSDPRPSPSREEPRTAQPAPRDREPQRQRPRDNDNDGHHGGGHGRYYGRYGYGYGYYPYYGPYGWWRYGWWGGPSPYGYPYGPGDRYYDRDDLGALDLDVSPARTEVYLDGQFLGTVDNFDGWPQYLWLDRGTYDLVLFREGYRTLARQITVYPGTVISIDDRMEPGESVRPESLASTSTERRDARLRADREREESARRRGDDDEDWRDRVRRDRERWRDGDPRDRGDDRRDRDREEIEIEERRDGDSGRVKFQIEPGDASVYLDGRFVGTGDDLARMGSGLRVDAGEHRLAVVRPGHQAQEMDFDVEEGEEVELEVELERSN
jgi:hypothetical protein